MKLITPDDLMRLRALSFNAPRAPWVVQLNPMRAGRFFVGEAQAFQMSVGPGGSLALDARGGWCIAADLDPIVANFLVDMRNNIEGMIEEIDVERTRREGATDAQLEQDRIQVFYRHVQRGCHLFEQMQQHVQGQARDLLIGFVQALREGCRIYEEGQKPT